MAKVGRNQPCPCGSGIKAKRCCGVPRGPSPDRLARSFLDLQAKQWAPLLADYTDVELEELLDKVAALPQNDLTLQLPLPRLLPPALERLRRAIADQDHSAIVAVVPDALAHVDTLVQRERLARAVLALHDDHHRIDCDTTAYAIIDLATSERSTLLFGALYEALAVSSGASTTPSGLLVAAR